MTAPQVPGQPPAPFLPPQPVNPRPDDRRGCMVAAIVAAVVVVLVLVGTLVGLVASRSTPSTTSSSPTTPSVSPPSGGGGGGAGGGAGANPTGGPVGSRTNPAPVGTSVSPAKDWTVRVTSAEIDGDETMKSDNVFVSPNTGKQFVIVGIAVTNGSQQAGVTAMNVTFSLLSPGGVATDASWARPPNHFEVTSQLQPGATLTGYLAFEVPSADAAGSVLLAEPVFTTTPLPDQRFLALG